MYTISYIWYNIYIIKLSNMNNKFIVRNFLIAARELRDLGRVVVKRHKFGPCTELRATLEGSDKNVVIYMGCLGHMRLNVNFIK